jgi:hypothetical protein
LPEMAKRIVAGIVGVIALVACFFASFKVVEAFADAHLTDVSAAPWWAITAELLMCSMALGALVIGFRFLDFALTGRSSGSGGRWLRPILLGCGLFFPVFVASLTVGLNWAYRMSHGEKDQNAIVALRISFFLGVLAALIGSVVLVRRARACQMNK